MIKMTTKRKYVAFSQKKFEFELFQMKKALGYTRYDDVTEDLIRNGYKILERVYMIKTVRNDTNILVYSSLDTRSDRVRTIGSDAVRVVIVRKNKQGKRYFKSLGKHLRISTLFNNLQKTIEKGLNEAKNEVWFKNTDKFYEGFGVGEH